MPLPTTYETHRLVPAKRFDDLKVGDRYPLPSRTLGDGNFAAFQAVSLDNHPIHYDAEYCAALGYPGPLAHGLQVLCFTAAGAGLFPHEIGDSLIGMIEVSARVLKPAYAGGTLYPALEITDLTRQRTTGLVAMSATVANQRGETVLEGRHVYLLRL
ncbi:MAG TPA: MaoC family dehydratase [Caulobacteraceae bacterium]|nr:MaoC family dehydratase [Caulobacteraceae bacterium]